MFLFDIVARGRYKIQWMGNLSENARTFPSEPRQFFFFFSQEEIPLQGEIRTTKLMRVSLEEFQPRIVESTFCIFFVHVENKTFARPDPIKLQQHGNHRIEETATEILT